SETDLLRVVDRHVEELGQVLELALHVGVPQIVVAFAAAPKCVTTAPEFLGHFESLLYLSGSECKRLAVRARRSAVHIEAVNEEIGGAPEQADAGTLLLLF